MGKGTPGREFDIEIIRLTKNVGRPVRGVLMFNGDIIASTLELEWKYNVEKKSCIPEGLYQCVRTYDRTTNGGLHIPVTFEIKDVPSRGGILFHVGNTAKDTQGCILLGLGFGIINKQRAILNSRLGFQMFLEALSGVNDFTLRIRSDEYQSEK